MILEYALSSETVIVGGCGHFLRHANGSSRNITATEEHASAAALVFVVDKNKPPGNFENTLLDVFHFSAISYSCFFIFIALIDPLPVYLSFLL